MRSTRTRRRCAWGSEELALRMEPRERAGPTQALVLVGQRLRILHVFGFEERPIFGSFLESLPELVLLQFPKNRRAFLGFKS
ncbi:hypothetical protein FH972_026984 [Carpinus fangiana]|uniref:Uncharacterized protein n=1 Tax=Carpinus fangiana TaxID=176857 RepID=A0A5N6L5M9_9ROSI|nr:hypothetical protein FH972_026984 [Carpinus fangiana]